MEQNSSKSQANKHLIRESMAVILQKVIHGMVPKGAPISKKELDAFTQLMLMSVVALGNENPRKIMEEISDYLLAHIATRVEEAKKSPAVHNICQLALIEWCRRNDFLEGDWEWKWKNESSGEATFKSKISPEEAMKRVLAQQNGS